MVIWIIGMSGSGKSTLGQHMVNILKPRYPQTVFLDGDILREIMGEDLGHTVEDRWANAQRICRLCKYLEEQEIDVVCAVLSIFHESQEWNREHLNDYKEIYLEVSLDTLKRRDPRGLYAKALRGDEPNVVGIDIDFNPPYAPDTVINNDVELASTEAIAKQALMNLGIDLEAE
jgi:adenylylsulfate kinase